jgi:hypothetical protein
MCSANSVKRCHSKLVEESLSLAKLIRADEPDSRGEKPLPPVAAGLPASGSAEGDQGFGLRPYSTFSNSTSNTSVALGGITPPAPFGPYAKSGGIVSLRTPPTFIPVTP